MLRNNKSLTHAVAATLMYPGKEIYGILKYLSETIQDSEQKKELSAFQNFAETIPLSKLQEIYTRTFDLMAISPLYAGHYVFGEDTFKRSAFLSRLAGAFENFGFSAGTELPDFFPLLLMFSTHLVEKEMYDSLLVECLTGPLQSAIKNFEGNDNAYKHILNLWILLIGSTMNHFIQKEPAYV